MPKEKKDNQSQSNQYDKILQENLEITLPVIIKEILGLDIVASEELPDDVQHTKERKPDVLKKVTDTTGSTYVLQIEFQVKNDREMVYRMAEYSVMLMRRYRLPVKQYVIYLGERRMSMPLSFNEESHTFSYNLIPISTASYKLFLKSESPEVKMLGILSNFGNDDELDAVKRIVEGVKAHTTGDFAESRFFNQMRIFVQLRSSVVPLFDSVMETVSKFFKEERDILYRRGAQKKSYDVVENLILELGLSDEQAARIAEVDIDFVRKVRAGLAKKKK
ncbi:Rpn family recombination-promoting nuclease/putative transposase [Parapedobacter sp. GCM10030251]|uniref:Rpn family recombination-promoting nuclease/putative transposase n=1 Tax=Parapedobacter sp. GCM10030251 TaxID=3273419 RepID=UPI0036109CED